MSSPTKFIPFAKGIYMMYYPIHYGGCQFNSVMTVIQLSSNPGTLLIHSPCHIDDHIKEEIEQLGRVTHIVAPGNFHHLHVMSCKEAFPTAQVYLAPELDQKRPDLLLPTKDGNTAQILHDDVILDQDLDHIFLGGNRIMSEVVLYHKPTKTLLVTDSIEYIGDKTPNTNWVLKLWWHLFRTWNVPLPAPEYRMGWIFHDTTQSQHCMEQILQWDFDKVLLSHGDNITENAKSVVRKAWSGVLGKRTKE